jgi:hypothetical protein
MRISESSEGRLLIMSTRRLPPPGRGRGSIALSSDKGGVEQPCSHVAQANQAIKRI